MGRAFWSDEAKGVLRIIVEHDGTPKDAARILGRSEPSVISKAYELGLSWSCEKKPDMDAFQEFLKAHKIMEKPKCI